MNETDRRHLPQVPTLTEVIEVSSLHLDTDVVLEMGSAQGNESSHMVVSGNLREKTKPPSWTPLRTLVVPERPEMRPPDIDVGMPPLNLANLPVLSERVLTPEVQGADVPMAEVLTEEVVASEAIAAAPPPKPSVPDPVPVPPAPAPAPASAVQAVEVSEDQIVQRVMADVQRRVDSMLEFRLREAMAPILARHAEAIIQDLRNELSLTMRDVVTRSVAQEVAKLRLR